MDRGARRRVKILDFGLARSAAPATGSGGDPATAAGAIMGTPAYMSPEQARSQTADPRSDIFSLGVVLSEMATGRKPFTGPSAFDVMAAVVTHDPPPVIEPVLDFPPALSDLIRRMLAKAPADRPQTAAAVAEELAAVERGLAVPPVRVLPPDAAPGAPDPWADIAATEADETVVHAGRTWGEKAAPALASPKWLWPAVAAGAVVAVALAGLAARAEADACPEPTAREKRLREELAALDTRVAACEQADLELPRAEVTRLEAAVSAVAGEVLRLRIDMTAPPRVHLLALATVPGS